MKGGLLRVSRGSAFLVFVGIGTGTGTGAGPAFPTRRRAAQEEEGGTKCAVGRDARGEPCVVHVVITLIRGVW